MVQRQLLKVKRTDNYLLTYKHTNMTQQEAANGIGQKFKMDAPGLMKWTDTIISVDFDGNIHGAFITAHCTHCRFLKDIPPQFKKAQHEKVQANNNSTPQQF